MNDLESVLIGVFVGCIARFLDTVVCTVAVLFVLKWNGII